MFNKNSLIAGLLLAFVIADPAYSESKITITGIGDTKPGAEREIQKSASTQCHNQSESEAKDFTGSISTDSRCKYVRQTDAWICRLQTNSDICKSGTSRKEREATSREGRRKKEAAMEREEWKRIIIQEFPKILNGK